MVYVPSMYPRWKGPTVMNTLTKCKDCDEQIDVNEYDCEYCEDCCHENQMSWQTTNEGEGK